MKGNTHDIYSYIYHDDLDDNLCTKDAYDNLVSQNSFRILTAGFRGKNFVSRGIVVHFDDFKIIPRYTMSDLYYIKTTNFLPMRKNCHSEIIQISEIRNNYFCRTESNTNLFYMIMLWLYYVSHNVSNKNYDEVEEVICSSLNYGNPNLLKHLSASARYELNLLILNERPLDTMHDYTKILDDDTINIICGLTSVYSIINVLNQCI